MTTPSHEVGRDRIMGHVQGRYRRVPAGDARVMTGRDAGLPRSIVGQRAGSFRPCDRPREGDYTDRQQQTKRRERGKVGAE